MEIFYECCKKSVMSLIWIFSSNPQEVFIFKMEKGTVEKKGIKSKIN
jgi:hypothetical protein